MRPLTRVALISIAAIIVAHLLDRWAWQHLVDRTVYDRDWGRMLRTAGFLPTWLIIAAGLWLSTRDTRGALRLALIPTAAGAICAVLQVLIRRERPGLHDGHYYFRAFTDRPFQGVDFGLPSSHAIVAFAAAWVLCRMYPRGWPVWLGLAAGTAVSRVLAGAHFLSDVTVAAVAAYFVVAVLWRMGEREVRREK
ncbi:MAG: phosphatase PAP2 family protein [Gemmatimonadales bacterium]